MTHTRACTKRGTNFSIFGIFVSTPHWLMQLTQNSFPFSFCSPSVYRKPTWVSQSPTTVERVVLNLALNYSDCKRSRPKSKINFQRNSPGSIELVLVPKTRFFEPPSSASSNYPQPARDCGAAGWRNIKWGRTRQVSDMEGFQYHCTNLT